MIIDINSRLLKDKTDKAIAEGKVPLTDKLPQAQSQEYYQQLERVKESMERINALMNRLKERSKLDTNTNSK